MARKLFTVAMLTIVAVMLFSVALAMRPFGEPPSVMDDYIIQNNQEVTGGNSVVSAVVFDWRGYDTLGEATVLFTAFIGVVMLLRGVKDETE
ncbi:MAG: hydrogen gas-evolving membrane-bound hydrogenase subunit E [Chloroflexota bacterium]